MRTDIRRLLTVSTASLLLVCASGTASAEEPVSDEVTELPTTLVDELAPAEQQSLTDLTEGEGVRLEAFVETPTGPEIVTLEAGGRSDATAAAALLERQPSVEAAAVSAPVRITGGWYEQYGNDLVRAEQARTEVDAATLDDVVVAVLDTGVAPHAELASALVAGQNFTDSPGGLTDATDRHGHGTHVAGTIGADAGSYVEGVAPGVRIMPVKVLGDSGGGWTNWAADGIIWAADNGADVINMSLGGSSPNTVQAQAIAYARSKGVTVVAAAGNDNTSTPFYPAADTGVIAVAAVDQQRAKASFSNYGSYVDVAAPGVSILSTYLADHVYMSGTSMASPHVAGVVALMEAVAPALTPDQLEQALAGSATDLGAAGRDDLFGHGLVDAVRAVQGAKALAGGGTVPVNTAPVATADTVSLPYNPGTRTLAVTANDTDADGDPLQIVSATQGTYGTVATTATSLQYTPTRSGPFADTVTYTVSDGRGGTAVGTVRVSVAAPPAPVVRKPSAPRIGARTPVPSGVRLRWAAPADTGGAVISAYRVTAYQGSTPVRSVVVDGRTTTVTVTGLRNGTPYRLAVQALNSAGQGPRSALVTATPRTKPTAPRISSVRAQKKAVAVRWVRPANTGGAPVTGYVVRVYSAGKLVKSVAARATTTRAVVRGLAPGKRYVFRVVAKNAAGLGKPSASKAARPR
ncbi:S8 family serine peptidase [Blastococcus goldschmidtiae]|uniref:S8 family serine peptidase n=1 Tax=Blastococcus goldschmidtiae TaxID=3075546 RepID=A0ABU2K6X2_9ACTN|nr:S8 family serine peptidase [Blastococcus sp. DSM 46792]MDT0275951.1 S8 family serine peptidase [Blastococcus sp. DSM 46792]